MSSSTETYWVDEEGRAVLDESDMLENFRSELDEVYGTVEVAGYTMDTSRVLEEVDPIAFRQDFLAYADNGWTEIEVPWELSWGRHDEPEAFRTWLRDNGAPQTMAEDDL